MWLGEAGHFKFERMPDGKAEPFGLCFKETDCKHVLYPGQELVLRMHEQRMVTVKGHDRDFVLRKAAEFLRSICHGLTLDPIPGVLFTPSQTDHNGVARPGGQDGYDILIASGWPVVQAVPRGAGKVVTVA